MPLICQKFGPAGRMLTETTLPQIANATSYSQGEDYFKDRFVGRIKRIANTFPGKVSGTVRL